MNARFGLSIVIFLSALFQTGCTKQEPIASFSADNAIIAAGGSVKFMDQSLNNPISWEWTFTGGTPASSTSQNPSVTYDNAGSYMVSLSVTNEDGSDAVKRENYITVNLPAPEAGFTADKTSVFTGEFVSFTDQSTNEPAGWSWLFEGGTPSTSALQNPSVEYGSEGVYTVSLLVSNASGMDYLQKDQYITVTEPTTDLTLINAGYTSIDIVINSIYKEIPVGGSVSYNGLTGSSVDFYAETSGETSTGTTLGIELVWDNTIVFDDSKMDLRLTISSDYFFLYIKNDGTHNLTPLQVGTYHGLATPPYFTPAHTENIVIPADGVQYSIGYYESPFNSGRSWTQIRTIYEDDPSAYTYWDYPSAFTVPDTINQSVALTNPFKKSSAVLDWKDAGDPATYLYPDYARKPEEK